MNTYYFGAISVVLLACANTSAAEKSLALLMNCEYGKVIEQVSSEDDAALPSPGDQVQIYKGEGDTVWVADQSGSATLSPAVLGGDENNIFDEITWNKDLLGIGYPSHTGKFEFEIDKNTGKIRWSGEVEIQTNVVDKIAISCSSSFD